MQLAPLVATSALGVAPDALRERAELEGYLFCPGLLAAGAVRELRQAVLAVASELGWLDPAAPVGAAISRAGLAMGASDDPRWVELLREVLPHPAFEAVSEAKEIRDVLTAILGEVPTPKVGDLCRVVSGDNPRHTTPPHQDRFYVRRPGRLWTAWLPLGDCPLSLGPLAVLPRTHRQGLLPHGEPGSERPGVAVTPDAVWHAADLRAGDVILFDGLTVHRALSHAAGRRLRLSADFRFVAQ